MFNYLSQKVGGSMWSGEKKQELKLTKFPEPVAHDTFLSMQRQFGINIYDDPQLLAALKKKHGVTIYKEDEPPVAVQKKSISNASTIIEVIKFSLYNTFQAPQAKIFAFSLGNLPKTR